MNTSIERTSKFARVQEMKDIYPMFKLCRMLLDDLDSRQREKLQTRVYMNTRPGERSDDSIEDEVQARISRGEAKGRSKVELGNDYIKKYYPEYTAPSDAFGVLLRLPKNEIGSQKRAEARTIIDNCLSKKYGYLEEDNDDPETVYLTSEGRDFASPPYLLVTRKFIINVGLSNAYLRAIGLLWGVTIWFISILAAANFGIIKNIILFLINKISI